MRSTWAELSSRRPSRLPQAPSPAGICGITTVDANQKSPEGGSDIHRAQDSRNVKAGRPLGTAGHHTLLQQKVGLKPRGGEQLRREGGPASQLLASKAGPALSSLSGLSVCCCLFRRVASPEDRVPSLALSSAEPWLSWPGCDPWGLLGPRRQPPGWGSRNRTGVLSSVRVRLLTVHSRDSAGPGLAATVQPCLNTESTAFHPGQGPRQAALPSLEVQLPGPFLPLTLLTPQQTVLVLRGGLQGLHAPCGASTKPASVASAV